MKLTLKQIMDADAALGQVENTHGFSTRVSFRMSLLKEETEKIVKSYQKTRNLKIEEIKKQPGEVKDLKELLDYIQVGFRGAHNVPVMTSDFDQFDKELDELKERYEEIRERFFKLEDFEQAVDSKSTDGKKTEKKRVNLVTAGFMKAMLPFIEEAKDEREEQEEGQEEESQN